MVMVSQGNSSANALCSLSITECGGGGVSLRGSRKEDKLKNIITNVARATPTRKEIHNDNDVVATPSTWLPQ